LRVGRAARSDWDELPASSRRAKPAADPLTPPPGSSSALIVSPRAFDRQHGQHVEGFCDWLCLPRGLFDDFVKRVIGAGALEDEARGQVLEWARAVRESWQGRIPGDNIFDFWRAEWLATHGSNKPSTNPAIGAGLRKGL
jgi:hypothetical protein